MGHLYYDDSKQPEGNFYLGAFIYSKKELDDDIGDCIKSCGLDPQKDEFKSCFRMDMNPKQKKLRKKLRSFIHSSKICVVVSAANELDFKTSTHRAIIQIIKENSSEMDFPICISLDQGIFKNSNDDVLLLLQNNLNKYPVFLFEEQNSIIIRGIQVADLVASKCSIMLKEALGLIDKTVKTGPKSGYDIDINIGFELWADIRYNFFSDPPPDPDEWDSMLDCKAIVGKKGLFISENCTDEVKVAAIERFGEMYLGCIH